MRRTGGRADRHIASYEHSFIIGLKRGEQSGGVRSVEVLSSEVALLIPVSETLNKCFVGFVVEEKVFTGRAGIGGIELFAHGDEPVGFAVISERDRGGVDLFDLLADLFHFVPCSRNLQIIFVEKCLVIVENFGRFREGERIHELISELTAFFVIALDEIILLFIGEAEYFCRSVGSRNFNLAVDEVVKRYYSLCKVIKSDVVGVAVREVGMLFGDELSLYLVSYIVISADL